MLVLQVYLYNNTSHLLSSGVCSIFLACPPDSAATGVITSQKVVGCIHCNTGCCRVLGAAALSIRSVHLLLRVLHNDPDADDAVAAVAGTDEAAFRIGRLLLLLLLLLMWCCCLCAGWLLLACCLLLAAAFKHLWCGAP